MTNLAPGAATTATTLPDTATEPRWREMQRLVLLSVLMAFAAISTDLFLPAIPRMSIALGATQGALELTISSYLIGFSLGQLFWGPIGDRFGRRIPVAIGIVIFILGSAGCALATDVWQLIGWRVVQALGACASVVLARAMVRDLYSRERGARVLSTLMTIMAIAPLLGPSVGAQILNFGSWQAIFWTLVAIGLVTMAGLFSLPESLPPERRNSEPIAQAFAAYGALLGNRRLMAYAAATGFFYSGTFCYVASSSFAFIGHHQLSPETFALLFAVGIVGIMTTNQINARIVARFGSDRVLLAGTAGAAITGLVVALVVSTGLGGWLGLAISTWLFVAMNGFIVANAISSVFANGTPVPMACVIALSGLGSLLSLTLLRRDTTPAQQVDPAV